MADCWVQDMPVCYGVYLILVAGISYTQPVVYTATRLSFTVSEREQIMWSPDWMRPICSNSKWNFMLATSKLFYLPNFTTKTWVNP